MPLHLLHQGRHQRCMRTASYKAMAFGPPHTKNTTGIKQGVQKITKHTSLMAVPGPNTVHQLSPHQTSRPWRQWHVSLFFFFFFCCSFIFTEWFRCNFFSFFCSLLLLYLLSRDCPPGLSQGMHTALSLKPTAHYINSTKQNHSGAAAAARAPSRNASC